MIPTAAVNSFKERLPLYFESFVPADVIGAAASALAVWIQNQKKLSVRNSGNPVTFVPQVAEICENGDGDKAV